MSNKLLIGVVTSIYIGKDLDLNFIRNILIEKTLTLPLLWGLLNHIKINSNVNHKTDD